MRARIKMLLSIAMLATPAVAVQAQADVVKLRPAVVLINALPEQMSVGDLPITRKARKTIIADVSAELSRSIEQMAVDQIKAAGFEVVRVSLPKNQARAFRERRYRYPDKIALSEAADQMLLLVAARERVQWVVVLASFTKSMQIHAFGPYDGYGVLKRYQAPSLRQTYLYYNLDVDLIHVSDWQLRNRQVSDTCLFELPESNLDGRVIEIGQRIAGLLEGSISQHIRAQLAGVLTPPAADTRCAAPPGLTRVRAYYPREHPF